MRWPTRRYWIKRLFLVLTAVAITAIGAFSLYLIAANLFIRTRILRDLINEGPDQTWIDYASATTWWPGRVRVRGLRIRNRDSVSEWMITLDEGRASISLTDLLRRRFHPTSIRGSGLSLRVRSRLRPEEVTPSRVAFLPPILGFSDTPMRGPMEVEPAPTGREWIVRLENVDAEVREIWVDDWKYEGVAALTGGMILHPRLRLEVLPSSLEVHAGLLQLRGKTVLASTTGRLEALIHPCDLREVHGNDVFRFLTGKGRTQGKIESVAFLEDLLDTRPRISVQRGDGSVTAEVTLDRGDGHGSLDFSARGFEVRTPDQTMVVEAQGQIRLFRLDLDKGTADFSGSVVDLRNVTVHKGDQEPWPWSGRLALPSAIVTRPERQLVLAAHVEAQAAGARPLYSLLDVDIPRWTKRVLSMKGFAASADVTLGPSLVDVKALDAKGERSRIQGRYHREGKSVSALLLVEAGPFAVGVSVSEGKTNFKWVRARSWFQGNRQAVGLPDLRPTLGTEPSRCRSNRPSSWRASLLPECEIPTNGRVWCHPARKSSTASRTACFDRAGYLA